MIRNVRTPQEAEPRRTWTALLLQGAVVLGTVSLLSLVVGRASPNLLVEPRILARAWDRAESPDEAALIILGDSTAAQVETDWLARSLGVPTANLATFHGMQVAHDAWLLHHKLRLAPPPKQVLVIHTSGTWSTDDNALRAWMPDIPGPALSQLAAYEPPLSMSMTERLDLFARREVPLVGRQRVFRRLLTSPFQVFGALSPRQTASVEKQPQPWRVRSTARASIRAAREGFQPTSLNVLGLDALLALAADHDFQVFYAVAPVWDELLDDPDFDTFYDEHMEWLTDLERKEDRLHLVFHDAQRYPLAEMYDSANHLLPVAALDYTEKVSDVLNRAADPAREGASDGGDR